ncbi:MAG: hypothetical protein ACK4YP_14760 [Myxococcota bacterium]
MLVILSLSLAAAEGLSPSGAHPHGERPAVAGPWASVSAPLPALHVSEDPLVGLAMDGRFRFATSHPWLQPEARVAYVQGVGLGVDGFADTGTRLDATFGSRFGLDRGVYGGLGVGGGLAWDGDALSPNYAFVAYGGYAILVGERVRVSPELSVGTVNALSVRVEWGG